MKTIWKYQLSMSLEQTIEMPAGAEILCVQAQFNEPCIWVSVDPGDPPQKRTFLIVPTGNQYTNYTKYIGTFQIDGGQLVFHLFEALI